MDSLTHLVLGAAVGEILLGRKLGNKAMLLGAIGNTIPDLDVIYNFFNDDPIRQLEVHRSYSHSMFTHFVLAVPLAWMSKRWSKHEITKSMWYWFWFLLLFTHTLLDCCTTYGTQLFKPLTRYQVAFNNISVIDPLYTLPFLILLAVCLFLKRTSPLRRRFLWASVCVSSFYMIATFFVKWHVHEKFKNSLREQNISYTELNTTPTILNAILWSAIAYDEKEIHLSEYSLAWNTDSIRWITYPRNLDLIKSYQSKSLETITWFSDGNYFTRQIPGDTLEFYNVKWGRMRFDAETPDSSFMFYFKFYHDQGEVLYKHAESKDFKFSQAFERLMDRIRNP